MLNSKQRAFLRSLANPLDCTLHIGKTEVGDALVNSLGDLLQTRELVKASVLKTATEPVGDIAARLADAVGAEVVQVIGRRFVLYRFSKRLAEEGKSIVLPR